MKEKLMEKIVEECRKENDILFESIRLTPDGYPFTTREECLLVSKAIEEAVKWGRR